MHIVYGAILAVAGVYYVWRAYEEVLERRRRRLRQRLAYMLWVMAQQEEPALDLGSGYQWHGEN